MKDNFDKAILMLNSIRILLYGGYYEPKSDRDLALAKRLDELLSDIENSKVWYDSNGNLKEHV